MMVVVEAPMGVPIAHTVRDAKRLSGLSLSAIYRRLRAAGVRTDRLTGGAFFEVCGPDGRCFLSIVGEVRL